jgi:hypothetical protein
MLEADIVSRHEELKIGYTAIHRYTHTSIRLLQAYACHTKKMYSAYASLQATITQWVLPTGMCSCCCC